MEQSGTEIMGEKKGRKELRNKNVKKVCT